MLPFALGCAKLSILFFYFRIFAATTASKRYHFLAGLLVFVGLWTVAFFLSNLFQCRLQFWAFFGSTMDLVNNCPGTMYIDLSLCVTDFVTDLIILAIPVPLVSLGFRLRRGLTDPTNMKVFRSGASPTSQSRTKSRLLPCSFLDQCECCPAKFNVEWHSISNTSPGSRTIIASLLRLVIMIKVVIGGFDPELDEVRKFARTYQTHGRHDSNRHFIKSSSRNISTGEWSNAVSAYLQPVFPFSRSYSGSSPGRRSLLVLGARSTAIHPSQTRRTRAANSLLLLSTR